jgi:hypothetical protein
MQQNIITRGSEAMNNYERCEQAVREIDSKYNDAELFKDFLCREKDKKRVWELEHDTPLDTWARELVNEIYPNYVGVYVKQADDYEEEVSVGDLVAISLAKESKRGSKRIILGDKICKEFIVRGSFWHFLFIKSIGYFLNAIDADQALKVLDKVLLLIEETKNCKKKYKELKMLAKANVSSKLTEKHL